MMEYIKAIRKTILISGVMFWIYIISMIIYNRISTIQGFTYFTSIISIELIVMLLLFIIIWISVLLEFKRYIKIRKYPKLSEAEIELLEEYLIPYLNLEDDDFTKKGIDKAKRLYKILEKLKEDNRWGE